MAEVTVNRWRREKSMDRESIIRFQLLVYCHLAGNKISKARLDCLTLIGLAGKVNLHPFTVQLAAMGLFASAQSAKNVIGEMKTEGLLVKTGTYRKEVSLHPDMKIQSQGNILVEIKCGYRE